MRPTNQMNSHLDQLSSRSMEEVEKALLHVAAFPAIIDLYESIWKITYANAPGYADMTLAEKIVLMNEQEDLVPHPPVPVEEVKELDLGGFPEAVFFPELLRYKKIRRLSFWENNLEEIPLELFQLTSLEELYLGDAVRELPEEISQLVNLKKLHLEGLVPVLPQGLSKLVQLEKLELGLSGTTTFPEFLVNLPGLKELGIYGDPELEISPELAERFREKGIRLLF